MAGVASKINRTVLIGNSKISEPIIDSRGVINGFVINKSKGLDTQECRY